MDTELLKLFIETTQFGSFQKVADKNFVSQRAVSKRIGQLEDSLHVKLFLRESNKITLTAAGTHFLKRAKQLLAIINTTSYELQSLDKNVEHQLSAGYFSPFDGAILKKALFNLPDDISVTVKEAGIEHLVSDVLLGELDCAIIHNTADYHYNYQELGLSHFVVLADTNLIGVSALSPYATRSSLAEETLQEKPVIYYSNEESDYLKKSFAASLGKIADEINIVRETSYEQMQMLVSLNQAFAFYPGGIVDELQSPTDKIVYLPLETANTQDFTFEIICRTDNHKFSLRKFTGLL
ncbi:LysR family transcriptional regulator [Levilactobacillus cerevisiae]|uniref:LysR family transcriptional regulator n=1 Tax=Levilactobacillus cerevisiae TaxID=1704076 RepID=UPI00345E4A50